MDNLAHTLAGLALAEAGLKRRTPLGTATLAIAANLPDVDALFYLVGDGPQALAFRRGWTHGPIAMVVLPLALAGLMIVWDQRVRDRPGRRHTPVDKMWLIILAVIGCLSHPLLDLLNTYGVRLLMPFSDRWFYGDALFILDPWLWLILGVGVLLSRWRARRIRDASAGVALARKRPSREVPVEGSWVTRPARVAIMVFASYAVAMAISAGVGRSIVSSQAPGGAARTTMVGPVAVTPFRRQVVRVVGERYETGVLQLGTAARYTPTGAIERNRASIGVAEASLTRDGRDFLTWARFPFFTTEHTGDSIVVRMSDARYADRSGRGWASVAVTVSAP